MILAFTASWELSLIALALSPLMMLFGIVESSGSRENKGNSKKEDLDGINVLSESLNNIKLVKSINCERELKSNY